MIMIDDLWFMIDDLWLCFWDQALLSGVDKGLKSRR